MQKFRQKSRKKTSKTIAASTKRKRRERTEDESNVTESQMFKLHELTNGPGKLCMAFDIRRDNCDKIDLATSDEMWLEESDRKENIEIVAAKRIGIDSAPAKARDQPFRFYVQNNMFVSTVKPSQFKKPEAADDGK